MTTEKPSFMNYRALLVGAVILAIGSLLMITLAVLLDVQKATAPQLLTLSALWIVPAVYTALKANDGRLFHGMVMGLIGTLLVVVLVNLLQPILATPGFLSQLTGDKSVVMLILGGLWGAVGGLFSEIIHLRRIKKARKAVK